jgi:mitogen-activated protein kinase 1/3
MNLSLNSVKENFEGWDVGPEYSVIKLIGTGSYGSVVEAIHKPTN